MAEVVVRYFASARAAAGGVAEEHLDAYDVDDVLAQVSSRHGAGMARILKVSSLLLDGVHVGDPSVVLPSACTVDVLPPFAGG